MKKKKKGYLFTLLLLLFLPYFVLPLYNFPASDDYCYTAKVHELGFIDNAAFWYHNWTSRYTASSLISYPFKKGFLLWNKLLPYLHFSFLFIGLFLFLKKLFLPKLSSVEITVVTLLYLLLFAALLRSTASAFYWTSGVLTYSISIPLTLFLIPQLWKQHKTRQLLNFMWSSILIAVVIGTNEVILPLLDLALIVVTIWSFWEKRRGRFYLLFLLAIASIFTAIVMIAPGNYERMNQFSGNKDFWNSVFYSFVYLKRYFSEWIINGVTLFLTLAFIPFAKKNILSDNPLEKVKTAYLLLYPVISVPLIASMFFPAFWAMNQSPPSRAINVIYFFVLIFWFLLIICLMELYNRQRYNFRFLSGSYSFLATPKVFYTMIALFLLGVVTTKNYSMAFKEAFQEGAIFLEKTTQRHQYIQAQKAAGHTDIIVKPLNMKLYSFHTREITIDKFHWVNSCVSDYFGIRSIARTP